MNYSIDYETLYHNISSKLKKRLFKKPNYTEAIDSLNSLIKLMNEEECPEYCGVFYLSKARCESNSKNVIDQAGSLILAAENFFKAENKLKSMNVTSLEDFLECGLMCYSYSINLYLEFNYPYLALSSGLTLIKVLKEYDKFNDAIKVYNLLLSVVSIDLPHHLVMMLDLGFCLIKIRNFKVALQKYMEIKMKMENSLNLKSLYGRYKDIMEEAEIFTVLLNLLCKGSNLKSGEESRILNEYSLSTLTPKDQVRSATLKEINEEVYYHFISLIESVRKQSYIGAENAALDLQGLLTDIQNEIVREIVNELINPSGEAF